MENKEKNQKETELVAGIVFSSVKTTLKLFSEIVERCNTFEEFKECVVKTTQNVYEADKQKENEV